MVFGIKSREFYETPAPTDRIALGDLESLVQSRELIQLEGVLARRYAELVYTGFSFHNLRRSLQDFFTQTQHYVSGDVRLRLKGTCQVVGRRSPNSLYDRVGHPERSAPGWTIVGAPGQDPPPGACLPGWQSGVLLRVSHLKVRSPRTSSCKYSWEWETASW